MTSKPLTLHRLTIAKPATGALPATYTMYLSDGTRTDVLGSFSDTAEQIAVSVANKLLELNQTAYWHSLTPGLVHTLVKFHRAVVDHDGKPVHLLKDMKGKPYELTDHQWNNFTKLRFHGLAVKMGDGTWQLHWRASDFLRGRVALPKKVKTVNNEVVDHDDLLVYVDDVMAGDDYWQTINTLEFETEPREAVQERLAL